MRQNDRMDNAEVPRPKKRCARKDEMYGVNIEEGQSMHADHQISSEPQHTASARTRGSQLEKMSQLQELISVLAAKRPRSATCCR